MSDPAFKESAPLPELLRQEAVAWDHVSAAFGINPAARSTELLLRRAADELEAQGALLAHCRAFIQAQTITCAETVHQSDRVIENAYAFIEGVCGIVGYHKDPAAEDKP
jgi:hypothetical protein